jgi:arylsulfatase A-like enzyme
MRIIQTLPLCLFLLIVPATLAEAASRPPNYIVIFCDDLGYGDIGCFGAENHRTPHIDRMAREGMRLTSFYSTCGVCTPSRSSLMTGCYPRRVNMHEDGRGGWVLFPVGLKGLNPSEITVAEVLKAEGYSTAIVGKWHLGDQPSFLPTRQGFDQYFGIPYSNDMGVGNRNRNYPPLPLLRDDKVIETEPDQAQITRRYTEEAVSFIESHKNQPFFLYLPHTMPHNPVAASEAFAGKSANGGYGDAVEEIDWSTGQILDAVKQAGIDRQTLIIFTSDNGAARAWGGSNKPLSGFKGSTMEGGMRVPFVVRWPGTIHAGSESDELAATLDILPTLAALAGTEPPTDRVIDGHDISPILLQKRRATSPHEAFYYYFRDQLQAVRHGPWKLHLARMVPKRGNTPARQVPARLYNLDEDIAESTNIAGDHAAVVEKIHELAERARSDLGDRNQPGARQRPAGRVTDPRPLTRSVSPD